MGRSYTYHCVGVPYGRAMSKLEIAQEEHKAKKGEEKIQYWYAQTLVGKRILDGQTQASADRIRLPKLVTCAVCKGHNGKYYCPVCRGSGICKAGNESNWTPWQTARMRERSN